MTYYGYDSDHSAEDGIAIASGEHLDATRALYGYDAVQELNRRIVEDIRNRFHPRP